MCCQWSRRLLGSTLLFSISHHKPRLEYIFRADDFRMGRLKLCDGDRRFLGGPGRFLIVERTSNEIPNSVPASRFVFQIRQIGPYSSISPILFCFPGGARPTSNPRTKNHVAVVGSHLFSLGQFPARRNLHSDKRLRCWGRSPHPARNLGSSPQQSSIVRHQSVRGLCRRASSESEPTKFDAKLGANETS